MNFKELYQKHKLKIIMISPLLVASIFFVFSTLFAWQTISTTTLPTDFQRVKFELIDYNLQEIDQDTNQIKWTLKAETAQTNSTQTSADIQTAHMEFFSDDQIDFTIDSDLAKLDKKTQLIELFDNVVITHIQKDIVINAGSFKIINDSDWFDLNYVWNLFNKDGSTVSGLEGQISKDFTEIISEGNARVENRGSVLNADKIHIQTQSDIPIIATGNSRLIMKGARVIADEITISKMNQVKARSNVRINTDKVEATGENLIVYSLDSKPVKAVLTGSPGIKQDGTQLYADKITYDFKSEQAIIEGNVHSN